MNPNTIYGGNKETQCSCFSVSRSQPCGMCASSPLDIWGDMTIFHSLMTENNIINQVAADDSTSGKELNQLTAKERELLLEEIHGVANIRIEESSNDLMDERIRELEDELKKLTTYESHVQYERACFLAPHRVKHRDFRLKFLRADSFNAKKAARRMTNYFHSKAELFGEDKLLKDITLDDLDEDDMDCLMTGGYMILPSKDQSGRTLIYISQRHLKYKSWKSLVSSDVGDFDSTCRSGEKN